MDKLDLLYDHYKETFNKHNDVQKRRNKSFLVLCLLEAISFLMLIRPETIFALINDTIEEKWSIPMNLGNNVIQTLLWILIAYIMIRYVQDVLYIERQYEYLHSVEKRIANAGIDIFTREGDNYIDNYPIVLNLIDLFYKMFMPILFSVVNVVKIFNEWKMVGTSKIALVCDTAIFCSIFIITWFYFFEIHPQITQFCKKHIPLVETIARRLRRILKEV